MTEYCACAPDDGTQPTALEVLAELANAYVSKLVDFDRFAGVVGQIADFFPTLVKLSTALS